MNAPKVIIAKKCQQAILNAVLVHIVQVEQVSLLLVLLATSVIMLLVNLQLALLDGTVKNMNSQWITILLCYARKELFVLCLLLVKLSVGPLFLLFVMLGSMQLWLKILMMMKLQAAKLVLLVCIHLLGGLNASIVTLDMFAWEVQVFQTLQIENYTTVMNVAVDITAQAAQLTQYLVQQAHTH